VRTELSVIAMLAAVHAAGGVRRVEQVQPAEPRA